MAIEGLPRQEFYIRRGDLPALEAAGRGSTTPPGAAFIAPLANLMWDSDLIEMLFDFLYTWEVYKPASKRKWGYYVLPVLVGDRLVDLVGSRPKLRLLRYLATHEGLQTGRALAHAAGVEPKRAAEALADLVEAGLVDRRRAGRAFLYSINRDNYAVAEILLPAFINERDWLKRLGDEIRRSLPGIDSVILYGSWAKGKAQPQSDVDLLLVTRQNVGKSQATQLQERADDIRARMSERYGHPISLLIVGLENLRRRLRKRDRFIREILAEGQVLAGSGLGEVVAHG